MTHVSLTSRGPRLSQLDSLRGLAALFVVFNHFALAVPDEIRLAVSGEMLWSPEAWLTPWPWLRFTPLRLLVSNGAPVDLFFVLSGFVLALPLTQAGQPPVLPFLIKRFCRIYIPFAVSILFVVLTYALVSVAPMPAASTWLNAKLHVPDGAAIFWHLAMTGGTNEMWLNPVMWSLVHEMRISIVMPLLFLGVRRFGSIPVLIGCTLISVLASVGNKDLAIGSWQMTLHVLWMFSAGVTLAYNRAAIAVQLTKCNRHLFSFLVLVAVGLLVVPFHRIWGDFLIGMGAALLIALCLPATRLSRALMVPPLLWLGRISYSLYLIHFPILLSGITGGFFSRPSVTLLIIILLAADLTFRFVEAPAQRLGAGLAGKAPSTSAPDQPRPATPS